MFPIGLQTLLSFITIPIFTQVLTPKDFGVLALALVYAMFITGLSNIGMTLAFDRNYFQYQMDTEKLGQLLYSSLVFVIMNFMVMLGITIFFRYDISIHLTGSSKNYLIIIIASLATVFLNVLNNFYFTYYKNNEKASIYAKHQIFQSILIFVLSLLLVVYFKVGVIGIVLSQFIVGVILFIKFFMMLSSKLPFSLSKQILNESLKISYPLTPRVFFGIISTQFDKYMIGMLSTVGGVGIYHIGTRISATVFVFMTAIQNVFHPQVYQRMFYDENKGTDSIGVYLTPFFYLSTLLALLLALLSEEVITILTPDNYHGAVPIVTILCIFYGSLFFGKIPQLMYAKKTFLISIMSIFSIAINVGLNIPFIMAYGAIGAAWATMLAGLITSSIGLVVAQHYYKIDYEWIKISWILGVFYFGSVSTVSLHLLEYPYSWSLVVKIITMTVFLYLGVRYGFISRSNLALLKSAFSRQTPQLVNF
jgi:O-antigen/teichoic acid export membrane protein